MKFRLFMLVMLVCVMLFSASNVMASSLIGDIISEGNEFVNDRENIGLGNSVKSYIEGDIKQLISLVGNLVFACVTVILGAKYIWSGVEGRSSVKETLPTFIAAVIFFYLAKEITDLFSPKTSGSIGSSIAGITNYNSLAGGIVGTINLIVKYLAFAGIVFIGVKYMFASSDGKAQIKEKLVPMTLGIVLVFSASAVVDFIISVGQQTIK